MTDSKHIEISETELATVAGGVGDIIGSQIGQLIDASTETNLNVDASTNIQSFSPGAVFFRGGGQFNG